jgi:hypothetical protein
LDEVPLATSMSQFSYEPGASELEEIVRFPPASAAQVVGANGISGFP